MSTQWLERFGDLQALRSRIVGACASAVFVVIAGRAAVVALEPAAEATGVSTAFAEEVRRADIVDRNGELLATSVDVYSLFADPRAIWDAEDVAVTLGEVFPDIDVEALEARLSDRSRAFVWVRRGLTPRQRQTVNALGLEGLGFREESRRAYPRGPLAGHVLGYAGADGDGLAGIEYALNADLVGGRQPLMLTLDSGVQFALEAELAAAAAQHDIEGGAGVVMHAASGEVLAMASWPPLNPNRALDLDAGDPSRLDRAAGAVFELGSVFKPLTVAAGLENGVVSASDRFDTRETLVIRGYDIEDDHPIAANASLTEIIAHSSNIGTVRVAQRLGIRRHRDFLRKVGLLDRAPVELAGSAAPLEPEDWNDLSLATVSYGHGIAVTPVAFVSAFSAFANGGELMPPTLVLDADREAKPKRVMSAPTAALVTAMMRETVLRGTGERAEVAGYRVAGKTGTAEKPVAGGYDDALNISSFAALFPADSPEYVVFIMLDEPKADSVSDSVTAAYTAAPATGRVIERIAPLLGVAPKFEPQPASESRTSL